MIDASSNIVKTTLAGAKKPLGCIILKANSAMGISMINVMVKENSVLAFSCIINEFSIYLAKK